MRFPFVNLQLIITPLINNVKHAVIIINYTNISSDYITLIGYVNFLFNYGYINASPGYTAILFNYIIFTVNYNIFTIDHVIKLFDYDY